MSEYILEMNNISKTFPGVKALDEVNFKVKKGEIHCLVGENGAGKSTLMKVLSGVYPHGDYEGDIVFNGQVQKYSGISDSEKAGIAIIYQELALVPELTVYENIFLGHEIKKGRLIDWNETILKSKELLNKVKNMDPDEVKENITEKVTELQNEIRALDKEKVKEIAIKKATEIKDKATELVKLAAEKATPTVEKAAKEVRNSAAETLRKLADTVEDKPKKK